jgi:hypothetical protein
MESLRDNKENYFVKLDMIDNLDRLPSEIKLIIKELYEISCLNEYKKYKKAIEKFKHDLRNLMVEDFMAQFEERSMYSLESINLKNFEKISEIAKVLIEFLNKSTSGEKDIFNYHNFKIEYFEEKNKFLRDFLYYKAGEYFSNLKLCLCVFDNKNQKTILKLWDLYSKEKDKQFILDNIIESFSYIEEKNSNLLKLEKINFIDSKEIDLDKESTIFFG